MIAARVAVPSLVVAHWRSQCRCVASATRWVAMLVHCCRSQSSMMVASLERVPRLHASLTKLRFAVVACRCRAALSVSSFRVLRVSVPEWKNDMQTHRDKPDSNARFPEMSDKRSRSRAVCASRSRCRSRFGVARRVAAGGDSDVPRSRVDRFVDTALRPPSRRLECVCRSASSKRA